MVDGSGSIEADDFILENQFAKNTVEAFERRAIFDNGGTASYVQFGSSTSDEGTFDSPESFNAHVDTVIQTGSDTDIVEGTRPLYLLRGERIVFGTTYFGWNGACVAAYHGLWHLPSHPYLL